MSTRFKPGVAPEGMIPLCVPEIRGNEWKYVKDCLDTGWVSSVGSYVERFEADMARYVGTKHAVATVNGTAALHVSLLVAGVQPDDEVLVSTLTFVAPANAIRYVGAWPVFMDADPVYWQMDVGKAIEFLEKECHWSNSELRNKSTGRRVKAILPVHILGHPVDIDPISEIASKYNLVVVEDATEALGARYKGRSVGHLGDIACFSYNGNKLITTGGGGMITTNNGEWADKAKYFTTQAKDDPVEYLHQHIGYNYRLSNIQAALGCAQMEQLDSYIAAKRTIAETYMQALATVPGLSFMREAPWAQSNWWLFTLLVNQPTYGISSRALLKELAANGVQSRPLWQPLHWSPAHAGSQAYRCEVADELHRGALSLPCSVGLKDEHQERVTSILCNKALS
jgi:perosamine synthetase